MTGMTIRASLAAALIAASIIRLSGAYPNCAQHSNGGYNNYNKYGGYNGSYNGGDMDEEGEGDEFEDNGQYYYQDPGYIEQWYPNNGVPMPRACTDPASNPRGFYTANLAPCRLQYHKIAEDGDDSAYELSTACSDENLVGSSSSSSAAKGSALYEYVSQWPDECVGDFKRCYTVSNDERIFISEACRHNLVFPEGTTHVSLDCTEDKKLKKEAMDKQNPTDAASDPYLRAQQKQMNDEIHEMEKVLFTILGVVLVSCLGCLCAAYQLVVKPYQDTIKETRRAERDGLMMSNLDDNKSTTANGGLSEARVV